MWGYKRFNGEDVYVCNDLDYYAKRMYNAYIEWLNENIYNGDTIENIKEYIRFYDTFFHDILMYYIDENKFVIETLSNNTYIPSGIDIYEFPNEQDIANMSIDIDYDYILLELYESGKINKIEYDFLNNYLSEYDINDLEYEDIIIINKTKINPKKLYDIFTNAIIETEHNIIAENIYEDLREIEIEGEEYFKNLLNKYYECELY